MRFFSIAAEASSNGAAAAAAASEELELSPPPAALAASFALSSASSAAASALQGCLPALRRRLGRGLLLGGLLLGRLRDLEGAEPLALDRCSVPGLGGRERLPERDEVDPLVPRRDGAKGPVLGGAVGRKVLALLGEDEAGVRDVLGRLVRGERGRWVGGWGRGGGGQKRFRKE